MRAFDNFDKWILAAGLAALALCSGVPGARAADKKPPKVEAKMEILEDEPAPPKKDAKAAEAKPADEKAAEEKSAEEKPAEEKGGAQDAKATDAKAAATIADAKSGGKPKGAGGDVARPAAAMMIEDTPSSPQAPPPMPVGEEKSAIAEIIRNQAGDVQRCYERRLEYRPTLQGKLYVVFYIGPNGRVIGATSQGMDDPEMVKCVLPIVRKWEFEKPKSGGKLMVKYPFVFKPVTSGR